MSSRETGDVIMLGIGGFTPLAGFMTRDDWDGVCRDMRTADRVPEILREFTIDDLCARLATAARLPCCGRGT